MHLVDIIYIVFTIKLICHNITNSEREKNPKFDAQNFLRLRSLNMKQGSLRSCMKGSL